jgi:hypothetical protein
MTPREELEQVDTEIKRLEERRRELYERSTAAPENDKLCEDSLARMLAEPELFQSLEYPIEVRGIAFRGDAKLIHVRHRKAGLVRIRPCAEECRGKTFIGLYLGDLANNVGCSFNRESGVLAVYADGHRNPAIWVPNLQRLVFGYESWWGPIESEEQLADITDDSIGRLWYVQAMKAMFAANESKGPADAEG